MEGVVYPAEIKWTVNSSNFAFQNLLHTETAVYCLCKSVGFWWISLPFNAVLQCAKYFSHSVEDSSKVKGGVTHTTRKASKWMGQNYKKRVSCVCSPEINELEILVLSKQMIKAICNENFNRWFFFQKLQIFINLFCCFIFNWWTSFYLWTKCYTLSLVVGISAMSRW